MVMITQEDAGEKVRVVLALKCTKVYLFYMAFSALNILHILMVLKRYDLKEC